MAAASLISKTLTFPGFFCNAKLFVLKYYIKNEFERFLSIDLCSLLHFCDVTLLLANSISFTSPIF